MTSSKKSMFTIFEILDIVVMTLVIGYIFKDTFRVPVATHGKHHDDIVDQYRTPYHATMRDFWWGAAIIAPAIIIHEFGHKFTAMAFGMTATFHAACSTANLMPGAPGFMDFFCTLTVLSMVLKAMGMGFVFFVPGYVQIGADGSHLHSVIVAFAGPAVHLLFWLVSAHLLKDKKFVKRLNVKKRFYLFFFKQVNMFLFILNMIPIPGFDGFGVVYHLYKIFFPG